MIAPLHMLRIALGALMSLTALAWFLPDLLPFIRHARWTDPMTVRLIDSLAASGLLAVAKFIQLAGGLALLLNRAVPFALAAMAAVNVCGAFVAVLIEGDAVLGLLALLVLALNALLMFAYIEAYADMLGANRLADGEDAEPGANFDSLFTRPLGKGAPRKACLIAAIPLAGAIAFYWWVVPFTNGTMGLYVLALPTVLLVDSALRGSRGAD